MASEAPSVAAALDDNRPTATDDEITAEGRTATSLDPALQLRLDHAVSKLKASDFEGAADLLSDLMRESADRYGQLCPLIAPVYFNYGDALLAIAQSKSDALGDGAGATAGEGEGDEDDDDGEDVTGDAGGGGVSESKGGEPGDAAAGDGEEDLAEKEAEDEADDGTIAFECLDTARYIYERQARDEARDAALHKVRIRLGDAFLEAEEFSKATAEYRAALLLLEGAPPTDRRLPAVLEAMGQALVHEASSKAAQGDEPLRKRLLAQASVHYKGAAEAMAAYVRALAVERGFEGLAAAIAAEVAAGALTCEYPPGVTTTAIGLAAPQPQPAPGGAAGGAAAASSAAAAAPAEPEIRVFQTAFSQHCPAGGADAASASSATQLGDACEIVDDLLQRLTDIAADVGVSVARIIGEAGARLASSSAAGGAAGGAAAGGSAFDAPSGAAGSAVAVVVPIRRKPASAAAPAEASAPVPTTVGADAAAAAAAPPPPAAAPAAAPPLAGSKRAREGGAEEEGADEESGERAAPGGGAQLPADGSG